ncbi:hypothetical protein STRAU_2915 [Streptomyces aurantiacus JA 4570]|uniref:Uncharacterized protein n=1 Tax=Streptomyces aurantiacus JA 4570 TaxID=1286094 RepID=S3ZML3_9ACTN|nr:hypothetical protein STRAU_2915 [Streptomyces aurantiacus JA 4570]
MGRTERGGTSGMCRDGIKGRVGGKPAAERRRTLPRRPARDLTL